MREEVLYFCWKKILTRTSDSRTSTHSGRCTVLHSVQHCCCSHSLGPDTGDWHWPVRSKKKEGGIFHLFWYKSLLNPYWTAEHQVRKSTVYNSWRNTMWRWRIFELKGRERKKCEKQKPRWQTTEAEGSRGSRLVSSDKPSRRSFQVSHLLYRSTGSRCLHCRYHSIQGWGPVGKMRQDSDFKHLEHFMFIYENNEKYKTHDKKWEINGWRGNKWRGIVYRKPKKQTSHWYLRLCSVGGCQYL